MTCLNLFDKNWLVFLKAGNCVHKSRYRTNPRVHEGEKLIPLFFSSHIKNIYIIFVENLLCIYYLFRHSDRPKDLYMHAEIHTSKHKHYQFLACGSLLRCLCALRCLCITGLILLLADIATSWPRERNKMKRPPNQRTRSCRDLWKQAANTSSNDSRLLILTPSYPLPHSTGLTSNK